MNIKQLTTKLQEEATKIAMVKYQGQAEQFCFTKTQLENVLAEAVNQTLAYVSEEVEGVKIEPPIGETYKTFAKKQQTYGYNNALTDIQKILEVKK